MRADSGARKVRSELFVLVRLARVETENFGAKIRSLKYAFVLRRRVEVETGGVAGEIYWNAVISFDTETACTDAADARNTNLLWGKGNIVVAGLFDDGLAYIFFRASGIRCLHSFGLDCVFKLVIGKEGRNEFQPRQTHCAEDGEAEDQFQSCHKKQNAKSLVAKFDSRAFWLSCESSFC